MNVGCNPYFYGWERALKEGTSVEHTHTHTRWHLDHLGKRVVIGCRKVHWGSTGWDWSRGSYPHWWWKNWKAASNAANETHWEAVIWHSRDLTRNYQQGCWTWKDFAYWGHEQLYIKPPPKDSELTEKPHLGILLILAGNQPPGHLSLAGKPTRAWADLLSGNSPEKVLLEPLSFLHKFPTRVRREESISEFLSVTLQYISPRMIILIHNTIISWPKIRYPKMG